MYRYVCADAEAGKFCGANPFDRAKETPGLPNSLVVHFLAPRQFDRKEQPRIGPKFVNALAKPDAIGMQKNVAPGLAQSCRDSADHWTLYRIFPSAFLARDPRHRRRGLCQNAGGNFHYGRSRVRLSLDFLLIGRRKCRGRKMENRRIGRTVRKSAR